MIEREEGELDLMGVSALWDRFVDKYGPTGFVSADMDEVMKDGMTGLEYIERMAKVFHLSATIGNENDVSKAITDASRFCLLMYIVTMTKNSVEKTGMFRNQSEKEAMAFVDAMLSFIGLLDDDATRTLVETLVSVAMMTGAGIAIDEGFTAKKDWF